MDLENCIVKLFFKYLLLKNFTVQFLPICIRKIMFLWKSCQSSCVRFCFQAYFLFESRNGSLFTIFESDMGYKILRKCAALSSPSSKLQILSKSITYLFCASQSLSSWRCWLTQVGECCCTLFWLQDKTEQLACTPNEILS